MKTSKSLILTILYFIVMFSIGYYFGNKSRTLPEVDSTGGIQGFEYSNYLHDSFVRKDSIKVNNCWCYINLIYEKDESISLNVEKKWWIGNSTSNSMFLLSDKSK